MYVNNMFTDGAGAAYAFDGSDADSGFKLSSDRMHLLPRIVANQDFLWGTWDPSLGGDGPPNLIDGIPYTLNVNASV